MNKVELTAEDLRFNPPSFSKQTILEAVDNFYGLSGVLKPLSGERDQNHLLTSADGAKYVVKVAGPDEARDVVDYQIKVLRHIEDKIPEVNVPHNLKTLDERDFAIVNSPSGQPHILRILSFIDGVPFGEERQPSLDVIYDAGRFQGTLCAALSDFSHPSEGYFMPWDISQGLVLNPAILSSKYGDVERLIAPLIDHFKSHVLPKMATLRKQTIHNDAHTGNMLKSAPDADDFNGLIDFGDIAYAPVIQDLSIPLTRFISGSLDPFAAGAAYVKGFTSVYPLFPEELDILYDLILLRAALTVQLIDFRIRNDDANLQELIELYPSLVTMLEKLISLDRDALTEAFHQASNNGVKK